MRLHDPWLLALLLLLPLFLRWGRAPLTQTVRFPNLPALRVAGTGRRSHLRWIGPALRAVAFVLLVVALARPQLGKDPTPVQAEGIDIMLAVDVSGSMLAEDFQIDGERVNRLDAVRVAVRDFLEEREGDRVGLVLFAARPYMQAPLTLDHGWLMQNLYRARVGMIEDGTAVGSALASAVGHLEVSDSKSKIVILLTDGQNNAGLVTPLTAADAAKTLGYRIYTIGAGTRGLAPYPTTDLFGNRVYRPVPVDIDEKTLQQIAEETGGKYYRATDTRSLKEIYGEIDRLEKSSFEGLQYIDYQELYLWLLVPALLALFGEALLAETWLRVLP